MPDNKDKVLDSPTRGTKGSKVWSDDGLQILFSMLVKFYVFSKQHYVLFQNGLQIQ